VILVGATHLNATGVGFLIAAVSLVAAVGMVLAGWHSDRRRERHLHVTAFVLVAGAGFLALGLSSAVWIVVAGYAATVIGGAAIQAVFWLIPSDALHGRSAAVGLAAIGSIGMVGSFLGPWIWGLARDYTGGYQAGLLTLAGVYVASAALLLLARALARPATGAEALARAAAL
jgi:ACS family tartrate transporter-like MFS transporter